LIANDIKVRQFISLHGRFSAGGGICYFTYPGFAPVGGFVI
jgi:hypothetical protein